MLRYDSGGTATKDDPSPALRASGVSNPAEHEQPGVGHAGFTVLCVDDEPDALKLLSQTFQAAKYRVLLADGYEEAIQQARVHRPDLICLDIRMPGKDGYEIMKALGRDPVVAAIPVVVVSATDEQAKALEAGACRYLAKPVDPDALLSVTRDTLAAGNRRVLVVEDDPDTLRLLSETLSDHQISVRTATNGRDALARLATWTPSAILLDLMMPVMDGFRLLEHLRMDAVWRQVPVVILTSRSLDRAEITRLRKVSRCILTKGQADTETVVHAVLEATVAENRPLQEACP